MTDDDRPRLLVESGRHEGEVSLLEEGTTYIGRSSKCGLVLNKTSGVSRQHAQIVYRLGTYSIMDLDSRNGTFVNGEEVIGRYPLNDNDRIEISEERIVFHGPSGRAVTRTSARRRAILEQTPVMAPPTTPPMPPPDAAPVGDSGELKSFSRTDEFVMKDITNPKGPPPVPHLPAPALKERSAALPNRRHAPPPPPVTVGNQEITHDRPVVVLAEKSSPLKWILLLIAIPLLAFCVFDFGLNDAKITKSIFGSSDETVVAMNATDKVPSDKGTLDVAAAGKAAADKTAADKTAADKTAADKTAADKAAADKAAVDKAAADRAAADKAAADKAAADKAAADKAAADKAAADKAAADKAAADKAATDKAAVATGPENAVAPLSGTLTLKVRKGSSVSAGQSIGSVRGSIQSPISQRKLRTLKREERSFAQAADDARAKRELRAIRKEIAKLEARANVTRTLRSPIDGVVSEINIGSSKTVRKGDVVLKVRPQ